MVLENKSISTDSISVKSSKSAVATAKVSKGKVVITANKKSGTCKITVTSKLGAKAKITVVIKNEMALNKTNVRLKKGEIFVIKVKEKVPSNDRVKSCRSSKRDVATVSKNGVIKARKKGTTKITVTMKRGVNATMKVSVK